MPFDAGSAFVRVGALFSPEGFKKYDMAVEKARREKDVRTALGGDYNRHAFQAYDKALLEARQKTERQSKLKAKLQGDFDRRAFNQYNRALGQADRQTGALHRATGKLHSSLKGVAVSAGAVAAGYLSIAGAKKAITFTEDLGKATLILSRNLGLSAEQASAWGAVAKSRNIDLKSLQMGFTTMSRRVQTARDEFAKYHEQEAKAKAIADKQKQAQALVGLELGKNAMALQRLGLSEKDLTKHGNDFNFVLGKTADGFGKLKGGTERQALAQQLLGRGYANLLPLFRAGAKGMNEQLQLAEKYHVTLNGKTIKSVQGLIQAQREAQFATMGLQLAFGTSLAPTLTKVFLIFSKFVNQMETGTGAGGKFAATAKDVAHWIGQIGQFTRGAAKAIGDYLGQHPLLRSFLITMLKLAAVAKAILFVAKITGLASVVRAFAGLIARLVAMAAAGGAAEGIAMGEGMAGPKGLGGPVVRTALGRTGVRLAGVLASVMGPVLVALIATEIGKQLEGGGDPRNRPGGAGKLAGRLAIGGGTNVIQFGKDIAGLFSSGDSKKVDDHTKALRRNTEASRTNARAMRGGRDAVDQFGTSLRTDRPHVNKLGDEVLALRRRLDGLSKGSDAYKTTAGRLAVKQGQLNDALGSASPATRKAMIGFGNVNRSAQNMAGAVLDARGKIVSTINTLAKAVGIKSLPLAEFKSGNLPMGTFGGKKAGGGWLGSPGMAGHDNIDTVAPLGSVVLNRHQIPHAEVWSRAAGLGGLNRLIATTHAGGGPMVPFTGGAGELVLGPQAAGALNGALGMSPFGGLGGLFSRVNRKHYMASGGSLTGMIKAANDLDRAHFPYVWGGGHQGSPAPFGPMDCSGAVSYVLQHGGVPIPTMTSGLLANAGLPGPGAATVFANPTHTFMRLGGRYFGTSGSNDGGGAGWFPDPGPSYRSRFTQRHFMAALMAIPRIIVKGRDSAMRTDAQGGADAMRRFGNRYLSAAQSTVFGGGNPGDSGPAIRGRMSTFGPPLEAAGRTASGVSSARPGIAIFNRASLNRMFRVVLGKHQAMLGQTDIGPAPWTGRKIDVTGAGSQAMGINPRLFPTDAVGAAFPRASGGPVASGGHRQRSDLQQRSLDQMLKVWRVAKRYYPGASGFPKTLFIPNSIFVGMASNPDGARSGREVIWPDWMLRGTRQDPANSALKETMVHEWAHYFQRPSVTTGPMWQAEGGAQAFARAHAAQIMRGAGLPYKQLPSKYDTYMGYVRRVRGQLGQKWIDRGQFVGKGGGGLLQSFAGGGAPSLSVHLSPPKKGHGGGGGTKLDLHRFTAPLHVRIARYDHLQALNDDDAKRYEQKDREFGFSEEVLIDETTGAVNVDAVKKRANELTQLIEIRQRIYNRLVKMQATAKKVIKTYRKLLKALREALKHAAKKQRPGIKEQIKNYGEDLTKWVGQTHDLGFDINDARLDLKEIKLERASVQGTTATPQDAQDPGAAGDNPDLAAQLAQAKTITDNLTRENKIQAAALETFRGPGDIGSGSALGALFAAGGASLAGAPSGSLASLHGTPSAPDLGGLNSGGNIIIQTLHPADSRTLAAIAQAANRGNGQQGYTGTTRFVSGI